MSCSATGCADSGAAGASGVTAASAMVWTMATGCWAATGAAAEAVPELANMAATASGIAATRALRPNFPMVLRMIFPVLQAPAR